jgi:alanine racemase
VGEIDLDALVANFAVIAEVAGPEAPVRPVVKADAYGHGAVPVARALEAAGATGFCVATLDEGLQLREGGVASPILVLYPIPSQLAGLAAANRVAVTASSRELLDALLETLRQEPPPEPLRIHVEVDTGLGRGGFLEADIVDAVRDVLDAPGAKLVTMWTHFQAPEDALNTAAQLARFEAAARRLAAEGLDVPRRHAAASGGLLLDEVASLEGVRPGLALYGLVPDELLDPTTPEPVTAATKLRPCSRCMPVPFGCSICRRAGGSATVRRS